MPKVQYLISFGETRVLCNASVEEKVPPFMRGEGRGWVTSEYSMLPRATHTRSIRKLPVASWVAAPWRYNV